MNAKGRPLRWLSVQRALFWLFTVLIIGGVLLASPLTSHDGDDDTCVVQTAAPLARACAFKEKNQYINPVFEQNLLSLSLIRSVFSAISNQHIPSSQLFDLKNVLRL